MPQGAKGALPERPSDPVKGGFGRAPEMRL